MDDPLHTYFTLCGLASSRTAPFTLDHRIAPLPPPSSQRIGFVPKDVFFPLGPFSKRLIRPGRGCEQGGVRVHGRCGAQSSPPPPPPPLPPFPPHAEEPLDEEEEEEEKEHRAVTHAPKGLPKNILEAAKAAAAAAVAAEQQAAPAEGVQQEEGQYDEQYYDQQVRGGSRRRGSAMSSTMTSR